MRLRAKIGIQNINPYILVSAAQAGQLKPGWRKPLPVRIWVNGQPDNGWCVNLMPVGDGSFYLYLCGIVRDAAGVGVGDTVDVELEFDAEYKGGPAHPMPDGFAALLDADPGVRENWERLIPSLQKEILRYLYGLKSQEAMQRNLEKARHVLGGAQGRFLARDWSDGCPQK